MRNPFYSYELVLQEFNVDPESGRVLIRGRRPGLIALLLQLLHLDPTIRFETGPEDVRLYAASLQGQLQVVTPLSKVSAIHCGYQQSIRFLIAAGMLSACSMLCLLAFVSHVNSFGTGLFGPCFIVFSLLALMTYVQFFLSKRIGITVFSASHYCRVQFRGGLIGAQRVDLGAAEAASEVLCQSLLAIQRRSLMDYRPAMEPAVLAQPTLVAPHGASEPTLICPGCSKFVPADSAFCEHCGHSLASISTR